MALPACLNASGFPALSGATDSPSSFLKLSFPLQLHLEALCFSVQPLRHGMSGDVTSISQFIFLLSRLFVSCFVQPLLFCEYNSSLATVFYFFWEPLVDSWRSLLHGLFSRS